MSLRVLAWTAAAGLTAACGSLQAETLDLSLGSDTAAAQLSGPLRNVRANAAYDLGFLYSDDKDADLKQAHAGLLVTGDAGATGAKVTAGLGVRGVAADFEAGSGGAIDLGGRFEIRVPEFDRLGFSGYLWFAPKIISFGDFEKNFEYGAYLDYQVIRDASLLVGYREIRYEIDGIREDTVDDSIYAGLRLNF